MSMNTKKNVAIVLLVVSMLLWVLRKLNVLYIPGLSMILLAGSMIIVGIMMFRSSSAAPPCRAAPASWAAR